MIFLEHNKKYRDHQTEEVWENEWVKILWEVKFKETGILFIT